MNPGGDDCLVLYLLLQERGLCLLDLEIRLILFIYLAGECLVEFQLLQFGNSVGQRAFVRCGDLNRIRQFVLPVVDQLQ